MKRKWLYSTCAVALAVLVTAVLVACGGAPATGFRSADALGRAQVAQNRVLLEAAQGRFQSFDQTLQGIYLEMYNPTLTQMAREAHNAQNAQRERNFAIRRNGEFKYGVDYARTLTRAEHNENVAVAREVADSITFVSFKQITAASWPGLTDAEKAEMSFTSAADVTAQLKTLNDAYINNGLKPEVMLFQLTWKQTKTMTQKAGFGITNLSFEVTGVAEANQTTIEDVIAVYRINGRFYTQIGLIGS